MFLLSLDEVCRYFEDSTANLRKKGKRRFIDDENNSSRVAENRGNEEWWWLRSPGYLSADAAFVNYAGYVYVYGLYAYYDSGGIRPALWLNLD